MRQPPDQALYRLRVGVDGFNFLVMRQPCRLGQETRQFGAMLADQAFFRIADEQAVFQIEPPGARVEVMPGQQGAIVID